MVVIHKKKEETVEEKEARERQQQERAMGLQDEYQAKGFELVHWVQHHKGKVTGLIVLFFVIGGALSAYWYYQKRTSEEASDAYVTALRGLEGEIKPEEMAAKQTEVLRQLVDVADKYAGSEVSVLADLYAAHLAMEQEPEKSLKLYQKALKGIKKGHELYPLVMMGMAYAQEKNGQINEALLSFEAIINEKGDFGKDLALLEAARLALKSQQREKAEGHLAKLLQDYPASIYETNAKRLKESLK